jgi:hypothetical protein
MPRRGLQFGSGRNGDADPAACLAAVPLLFLREIERTDPLARVERLLV